MKSCKFLRSACFAMRDVVIKIPFSSHVRVIQAHDSLDPSLHMFTCRCFQTRVLPENKLYLCVRHTHAHTGMADPAPVAFTFNSRPEVGMAYRIDSILCLVDAKHITQVWCTSNHTRRRAPTVTVGQRCKASIQTLYSASLHISS